MNRSDQPDNAALPFALAHDDFGRLVLVDASGQRHVGVEPVRAFPLSDPDQWVSLVDAAGREQIVIRRLGDLPAELRAAVQRELALRDFLPVVQRIVAISTQADPSQWEVETDRGPARFVLASEDDIRRLGPHRAMIVDAQGVRYLIADTRALDAESRKLLANYL